MHGRPYFLYQKKVMKTDNNKKTARYFIKLVAYQSGHLEIT